MLSQASIDVLATCSYHPLPDGKTIGVKINAGQLARDLYEEVNVVLTRCGGKWHTGKKLHLFPNYDPEPLIKACVESGEEPPKNPTALFPTPHDLCAKMAGWVDDWCFPDDMKILEPSAGLGAIAKALRTRSEENGYSWDIHCLEILPLCRQVLAGEGFNLVGTNFLDFNPGPVYDAVVMNPPFSSDGLGDYIDHINHAWSLVKPHGKLMAIAPPSFLHNSGKRVEAFHEMVCSNGDVEELGAGLFKEAGTMISVVLIEMTKSDQGWREEPRQGYPNWFTYSASLHADNERSYEDDRIRISKLLPDQIRSAMHRHYEMVARDARKLGEALYLNDSHHEYLYRSFCEDNEIEYIPPINQAGQFSLLELCA